MHVDLLSKPGFVLMLLIGLACFSCAKFGFEVCVPNCTDKECGSDGCGGFCLPGCPDNGACDETTGLCEACVPDCAGRECGPDGCDGTCGPDCGEGEYCNEMIGLCGVAVIGEFVPIKAGSFEMGSPEDNSGRYSNEVSHPVTLTRSFAMMSTEVTQGQFESLMGYNPTGFPACGTDCPVEVVNWHEAAAYCNALSANEGLDVCYSCTGTSADVICEPSLTYATAYHCPGYRLPTDAEWEYAARAGTDTATYNGDLHFDYLLCEQPNDVVDSIAWFCGNSGDTTHPVGTRVPNAWGLYDMLGNVLEWCHDGYEAYLIDPATDPSGIAEDDSRVFRGSSWFHWARIARAAFRVGADPSIRGFDLGFRLVRTLP